MPPIKLSNDLFFAVERHEKRARLIVYKNGIETVCRRETFKNLERFIRSDERQLFKGRLQLLKNFQGIGIQVKGELAGVIKTGDFINYLESVKR